MKKTLAAAASVFLLNACAIIEPAPELTGPTGQPTAPIHAFHDTLDLSGRLSVYYRRNGKDESLHGHFTWAQMQEHTTITLRSPFATIANIEMTPHAAILTQAGQMPRAAKDADALVAETLGWPLPVSGLRYWLQGIETAASNDGWRIRYVSWEQEGQTVRPKRIDLNRDTAEAGNIAIRIVIDRWEIPVK